MAVSLNNIAIGGSTLSLGAYVPAGGAGSLTDVGALKDGSELSIAKEIYEVKSSSVEGVLRAIPVDTSFELKAILQEASLDNLRKVLGQPSANLTGTAPNKTLLVGNAAEEYFQGTVSTGGISGGTTPATRLLTMWKLYVKGLEAIAFKKGQEQTYGVTFGMVADQSVTTADKFYKVVDSGGA